MASTVPESIYEKMLAEKVAQWRTQKEPHAAEPVVHPFLAISRDFGCGEEELIPKLEKALGWKVYGKNILDYICQRDSLSREIMDTLDEQSHSAINDWIQHLIHSGTISQQNYVTQITRFIRVIAAHESAIFLGRGATFILADNPVGIRVYLTAPREARIQHIMKIRQLDADQARELVEKTDDSRHEFIRKYFKREADHPWEYDLVLNTQTLTADQICRTLKTLLDDKQKTS